MHTSTQHCTHRGTNGLLIHLPHTVILQFTIEFLKTQWGKLCHSFINLPEITKERQSEKCVERVKTVYSGQELQSSDHHIRQPFG